MVRQHKGLQGGEEGGGQRVEVWRGAEGNKQAVGPLADALHMVQLRAGGGGAAFMEAQEGMTDGGRGHGGHLRRQRQLGLHQSHDLLGGPRVHADGFEGQCAIDRINGTACSDEAEEGRRRGGWAWGCHVPLRVPCPQYDSRLSTYHLCAHGLSERSGRQTPAPHPPLTPFSLPQHQ